MAFRKFGAVLAISALVSPLAASAQTLTAEEILALLIAQRTQLTETNGDLGLSRTLEFVTESTPQTSEAGMALVTDVPGDAVAASTNGAMIPEEMVIDLTIFFEFDSALLKAESKNQVVALCTAIEASEAAKTTEVTEISANSGGETGGGGPPPSTYQIIGHTDASGSVQYNLSLSQARADEVVRYMVRECGIDGAILQAVGMGEARLKDTDHPRADANRRVEIQVVL